MQTRPTAAIIALLIASAISLLAASRSWKSEDGKRSISGTFLKRDASSITIRRSGGKEVAIPLEKLHPDDRAWLNLNHPPSDSIIPSETAVFDQLKFGDGRSQVLTKLKASKFVELTVAETFLGRTGLNGVFRTRKKIGGLDATLSFDWTDDDLLKEITLQTSSFPASDFDTKMVPCWKEFINLLSSLYGKPATSTTQLNLPAIQSGTMMPTHLWQLEKTGSVTLGAAREDDHKYQIAVRFTQKKIEPIIVPTTK